MVVRSGKTGSNAAATRWVSSTLPAARDYAGAFTHPRWRMTLERCRNGRPGCWPIEWTHDTYRFRLAEGVADSAACSEPPLRSVV
jgi:protein ImuA